MKLKHSLLSLLAALSLTSCGIYTSYKRPSVETSVYRGDQVDTLNLDTTYFGHVPWRSLFADPELQTLIDRALKQNVDLQTATLSVTQAEAQLTSARLSFLPSLSFAPTLTAVSVDRSAFSYSYNLPVQASWQIDLFGSLRNASRSRQALLLRAQQYQRLVHSRVVASVANAYYTLLMLDEQLRLSREAAKLATHTLEVMEAQKQFGRALESSVQSAKANLHAIQASIPEIERQITAAENSLSLLLGERPQTYRRTSLGEQVLPSTFPLGVPMQLLSNRPDVRVAELALANCFYQTNAARAAFYPSLNITASAGWTNEGGASLSSPSTLIARAVAGLVQPIFARGQLVAGLKVAKAEQEKALLAFQQSIYNAGAEVSNALALYRSSDLKSQEEALQIQSLQQNVEITETLFRSGRTTSYLEVITAQQSLLNAQLTKVRDDFSRMQAVVNLYNALGGGSH